MQVHSYDADYVWLGEIRSRDRRRRVAYFDDSRLFNELGGFSMLQYPGCRVTRESLRRARY